MQRHPGKRRQGKVSFHRRRHVPVDEPDQSRGAPDDVVGGRITVAHDETWPPSSALPPKRIHKRHEVRDLHKIIVGVHPLRPTAGRADRLAFEKGQYLPSFLMPAQWLWRSSEPGIGEM